jgi:5-methylcytosine-specific restriction endonuclease McrA
MEFEEILQNSKIDGARRAKEVRKLIKDSYAKSRPYLDQAYKEFRNSEIGKKWIEVQLDRCEYKCPECQRQLNENSITIDHKQPRKLAVWLAFKPENLWLLCRDCNWGKSDKSWDDYLDDVQSRCGDAAVKRILELASPISM